MCSVECTIRGRLLFFIRQKERHHLVACLIEGVLIEFIVVYNMWKNHKKMIAKKKTAYTNAAVVDITAGAVNERKICFRRPASRRDIACEVRLASVASLLTHGTQELVVPVSKSATNECSLLPIVIKPIEGWINGSAMSVWAIRTGETLAICRMYRSRSKNTLENVCRKCPFFWLN